MSEEGVNLKDYVETRFKMLDKATESAYEAMNRRLDGMNEFRDTLKDQASRFITRNEVEVQIDRIVSDIRILRESRANLEGKASQASVYIAYLIAIIGMITSVIGLLK